VADAIQVIRLRHRCSGCDAPVNLLRAVRFRGRAYCGQVCAQAVRDAHLKTRLDLEDSSITVCRCSGAPAPLEPTGPHCVRCRRMFSTGVRQMLMERKREERRPVYRLRSVLYAELRLSRASRPAWP
jgi:hypothetical protein